MSHSSLIVALAFFLFAGFGGLNAAPVEKPEPVQLAREAEALLPVYVPAEAGPKVSALGRELAAYLSKITGASFKVTRQRPEHAIVVSTAAAFPGILPAAEKGEIPTWKERFRLLSAEGSLYIIGESELAVQHGVFALLHELGYRQYFPTPLWEIIPERADLTVDIDTIDEPGYASRVLFYAHTTTGVKDPKGLDEILYWRELEKGFNDWQRKNRGVSDFVRRSGHEYVNMIRRNAEAFDAHPEWITEDSADWRATHHKVKFVIEHKELRELIARDAVEQLRRNPQWSTVSAEPSDGGGWPANSPLGPPSDQVVVLANEMVRAVREEFPEKKVAFFAYNEHSPAPSIELEKGVIVGVATHFVHGDFTPTQLLQQWRDKGAELGLRDYHSVFLWDYDLPGRSLSSDTAEVIRSAQSYYNDGARYWGTEGSAGWGAHGLGYYIAMLAAWAPTAELDAAAITDEFVSNSFGKAKEPMLRFYQMTDGAGKPVVSEDLAARMYRTLQEAMAMADDPVVEQRIAQFVIYTRYMELMNDVLGAQGEHRQEAFRKLVQFCLRCRDTQMFAIREVLAIIPSRNRALDFDAILEEEIAVLPEAFTQEEIVQLLAARVNETELLAFEPRSYSRDLVPSTLTEGEPAPLYRLARNQTLLWLAPSADAELELYVRGGVVHGNRGSITFDLSYVNDALSGVSDRAVIPPDQAWHTVRLKSGYAGLHRIDFDGKRDQSEIYWPAGASVVIPQGVDENSLIEGTYSAYFLVPAGVDEIGGYSEKALGQIVAPDGSVVFDFGTMEGADHFVVKIPPADQARAFKLERAVGKKLLMTVPPYLARHPSELLIPQ